MTLPEKPEPSVLDYVKSRLFPAKNPVILIPESKSGDSRKFSSPGEKNPSRINTSNPKLFWMYIIILASMLIGQKLLEPPRSSVWMGIFFYACGITLVLINWFRGRFATDSYSYEDKEPEKQYVNPVFLSISIASGLAAGIMFTRNRFTPENIFLWIVSILFLLITFFPISEIKRGKSWLTDLYHKISTPDFHLRIDPWSLLFFLAITLVAFFRLFRLNQVPIEMISDHAEKLLDVNDVLGGKLPIFFLRNTGREAFQMYLSAVVALVFGTGISFMTLKIGTAIMGLFTAVYVYLLGRETGNRWVGLFAFILCGIGYWPNVISRVGLRFTLYSAFTAPALFYFFRGLRKKKLIDLVLSGISIGIGLQGYSPYRVVPVLIALGVILYMLHFRKREKVNFAFDALFVAGFAALILFLPTFRYMLDNPDMFSFRALSRATSLERDLPGPAIVIFLKNLWNAVTMPFYLDGTIWVHSVANRPALDVLGGAMFMLGLVVSVLRYIKQKDWRIPFLILSIPFLMLPSILSLAFPEENPCLNRTAGALVPIFVIAAFGLDAILRNLKNQFNGLTGTLASILVFVVLLAGSIFQNYNLVFVQYSERYRNSAWNSSQIGGVIRDFTHIFVDTDSAYVVGFPYWVDTRLVAMNAGYPSKDYAIWPKDFEETKSNNRAKLFILYQNDTKSLDALRELYPDYYEYMYRGWIPAKDFIVFLVPPAINSSQEVITPVP